MFVLTREDIQALSELMDSKLEPIKNDLLEVKANLLEVREATNYIADWVEQVEKKVDRVI